MTIDAMLTLIAARCPELDVDELIAALQIAPEEDDAPGPDTLPAAIAEEIVAVIELLEDKLETLLARLGSTLPARAERPS